MGGADSGSETEMGDADTEPESDSDMTGAAAPPFHFWPGLPVFLPAGGWDDDDEMGSFPPCVSIGLCLGPFVLSGWQPGWDAFSLGYHGDDGRFFHGTGRSSRSCGPSFGPGDTVGCGLHLPTLSVFFTRNGALVSVPCVLPSSVRARGLPIFSTIGVDSHDRVRYNAGHAPFAYDPDTPLPPPLLAAAARNPHVFDLAVRALRMREEYRRTAPEVPGPELVYGRGTAGEGMPAPR
jgi:hypothetical protein